MKTKTLLAILTLILLNLKSFSQEYFPLLNNSSWTVFISNFDGVQTVIYTEMGDVIVGNYTYKKYDSQGHEVLLREDIAGKKIYKLMDGNDVLLYDFSLQVSDNIILADGENYQVQSITNININGGQRRQFYLRNADPFWPGEYWIEGVGRRTHPLLAKNEFFTDPEYYLLCSHQNGINIFNQGIADGNTPTNCTLSVEEQNVLSKKITFAPNPFRTELIISTKRSLKNSSIKIYNSLGQMVMQLNNINGNEVILKRENLNSGIYLIQIFENEKLLISNKVLVTN